MEREHAPRLEAARPRIGGGGPLSHRMLGTLRRIPLTPVVVIVGLVVVSELAVPIFDIPRFLFPPPSRVGNYLRENIGFLLEHTAFTTFTTVIAFVVALIIGIALAVLMVWSPGFEKAAYPLIVITQVVPKVAIAPLLIIYLGWGINPKIVLGSLVAFFPIVVNTSSGLKSVSREMLELLATVRATKAQVMWKVRFQAAIPYIVEGAKIAIALAVIGTIVAEMIAGSLGLGYLIAFASSQLDTTLAFASLFLLVIVGNLLFIAVTAIGNKLVVHRREATIEAVTQL